VVAEMTEELRALGPLRLKVQSWQP
jgi:hypothetical protein